MDVGIFQRSVLIKVPSENQQALTVCPIVHVSSVNIQSKMIFVTVR